MHIVYEIIANGIVIIRFIPTDCIETGQGTCIKIQGIYYEKSKETAIYGFLRTSNLGETSLEFMKLNETQDTFKVTVKKNNIIEMTTLRGNTTTKIYHPNKAEELEGKMKLINDTKKYVNLIETYNNLVVAFLE